MAPSFIQPIPVSSVQGARQDLKSTIGKRECPLTTRNSLVKRSNAPSASALSSAYLTSLKTVVTTSQPAYATVNPFELDTDIDTDIRMRRGRKTAPYRNPIVIIPGFGASHMEYCAFESNLQASLKCDVYSKVVPVTKGDWMMSLNGRPMTRVLKMIDEAVREACIVSGQRQVTIVAHSAGGWIARVYLGHEQYHGVEYNGRHHVDQLICLGTPHHSKEPVTKKNMTFVNTHYPGAFYDDVEYLNFAGDGATLRPNTIPAWQIWHPLWMPKVSYRLTDPEIKDDDIAHGDGIVPLTCTFLSGASANVILKGVWHSESSGRPWYGDEQVVKYWSRFIR